MEYREIGTKNLRHIWSVLCSNSVLNADNNNLNLNNLVERLTFPIKAEMKKSKEASKATGYMMSVELEVVSRFKKETDEAMAFEIKFDFVNSQGAIIASLPPNKFGIQKEIKSMRIRSKINAIPVDQSGEFTIVVLIKEAGQSQFTEVDRIPLDIVLKDEN